MKLEKVHNKMVLVFIAIVRIFICVRTMGNLYFTTNLLYCNQTTLFYIQTNSLSFAVIPRARRE